MLVSWLEQPSATGLLQKILQTGAPLFKKSGLELGYYALGRQRGYSSLEVGECHDEPPPKVIKLGVSLPDVHAGALR